MLRFCLVLGRVLMVVYCCASGCFGCVCVVLELVPRVVRRCGSGYIGCRCIWTHLLQMQSGRCLGGGVAVRSRRVVRRCGSGYIGASGCFGCVCVVLELVPRVVRRDASGPIFSRCRSGRCLGSVITSSFRASESNVRQFSWVVWRCVFVWFWGVF